MTKLALLYYRGRKKDKAGNAMYAITEQRNPLAGLISDDVFNVLEKHNLLSEKAIRDYQIRQRFRVMRSNGIPAYEAIERLRETYGYLQFDTMSEGISVC